MKQALIIILLIVWIFDAGLLVFSCMRQDRRRSIYFTLLTVALMFDTIGYLLEVMSITKEATTIALNVQNVGIPMIAPLFLLTVMSLFRFSAIKRWMLHAVLIYGTVMLGIILFNEYHHLYYTSIDIVSNGSFYVSKLGRGPIYIIQQAITGITMLIAFGVLFSRYKKGNSKLRSRMTLLIVGSCIAFFANIINFCGVLPNGMDPTPFALAIAIFLFAINLFRHRLYDLAPVAAYNAVETMDDAIVILDNGWGYISSNSTAKEIFPGLLKLDGTEPVEKAEGWPHELAPMDESGQIAFSYKVGGRLHSYRAQISKVVSPRGTRLGWSIVIRDITDMIRLLNQLEEMATIDPLTGILNRRQFEYLTKQEIAKANRYQRSLAIIMFDLDMFKNVNDKYGHVAGDYTLCRAVDIVKVQLRSYDIFARYGGEEFMIVTIWDNYDGLKLFVERLRKSIEQTHIIYEGQRIPVTASFGVVKFEPGMSFEKVIKAVDNAMYKAKEKGRNQIMFGEVE